MTLARTLRSGALLAACVLFAAPMALGAPSDEVTELKLPAFFSDNMILQRDEKIALWGWDKPGIEVRVTLGGKQAQATAGKDGKWMVRLGPFAAGGPHEMTVTNGQTTRTISNILFGDVWICSGQSNMEMAVHLVKNAQQEIAAANYPQIRLFTVPRTVASSPQKDVDSPGWFVCSPDTVTSFSATAFFFGRDLHKHLNVPIGLLHTSWGGTPVEVWTSAEMLSTFARFKEPLASLAKTAISRTKKEYDQDVENWRREIRDKDAARKNGKLAWAAADCDTSDWQSVELPGLWEKSALGEFDGVVWFSRSVEVPDNWAGKDLVVHLGALDDEDDTWFNGQKIGSTAFYATPRHYRVPGSLVKAGKNTLTVRVLDFDGAGGFSAKPEELYFETTGSLAASSQESTVPLAGQWRYKVGLNLRDIPPRPIDPSSPYRLAGLYNGMIAPIIPYTMKGFIWYQGEANAPNAYDYRKLFPAMIRDWRSRWGQGNAPFLFVQLANFLDTQPEPGENDWAELREAQLRTLCEPATGMAVTVDIGEAKDIHPRNKQDVGRRLALAARAVAYGEKLVSCGPLYRCGSARVEGKKVRLSFDSVGEGLAVREGSELKGFAVAGRDRKFVWAKAKIEGNEVVVWSEQVEQPVAVRYGWAANPECNLVNREGLPASPFRTDDWPGITQK